MKRKEKHVTLFSAARQRIDNWETAVEFKGGFYVNLGGGGYCFQNLLKVALHELQFKIILTNFILGIRATV